MVIIKIFSVIGVVFGVMTVISGSSVLFTSGSAQISAGNYVGFVVWFNFLSGIGYIITGMGLWKRKQWSVTMAIVLTVGIVVVLLAFAIHVILGGEFEIRTFYALTFRMLLWLTVSVISYRKVLNRTSPYSRG